jgi:bifunctional DNase/RNase
MFREMKVSGLTIDPFTNTPIIILKDLEGKCVLPIWIGLLEASAIATELENIRLPRPMTHDLLGDILDKLKVEVKKVEVAELKDNTFFANLYLTIPRKTIIIDARPSDAIAIALRTKAPIFVNEKVIEKSREINLDEFKIKEEKTDIDKLKEILETMSPEDFGKYKM